MSYLARQQVKRGNAKNGLVLNVGYGSRVSELCAFVAILLIWAVGVLAVWAGSTAQAGTAAPSRGTAAATFSSDTAVDLFVPETGEWKHGVFAEVKPGSEFTCAGHLYRMAAGRPEMVAGVAVARLADADRAYDRANHRLPRADDVVQVLDKEMAVVGHAVLSTLKPGTRVCFQGRAYDVAAGGDARDTGMVANWVIRTCKKTDILVDVYMRSADGKICVVSGIPERPLLVYPTGDYAALGSLKPDTALKTANGSTVSVVRSGVRRGSFDLGAPEAGREQDYYISDKGCLVRRTSQIAWDANLPEEERQAVLATLSYIDKGAVPQGALATKWGAYFGNFEHMLPAGAAYKEYRVAPAPGTKGAGTRRIVTGSNGAFYYTRDHYASFVRIR